MNTQNTRASEQNDPMGVWVGVDSRWESVLAIREFQRRSWKRTPARAIEKGRLHEPPESDSRCNLCGGPVTSYLRKTEPERRVVLAPAVPAACALRRTCLP